MHADEQRYSRQSLLAQIGVSGQQKIAGAHAAIVGCGALGCGIAALLVRAGIGQLTIIDRDWVEIDNLHRQTLFDEQDALNKEPKARAAQKHLSRVNRNVLIKPVVTHLDSSNSVSLLENVDIILDGTDNFETRYLLNDVAVKLGIPWVYGGVIGTAGLVLSILPGKTPCFRCLFPEPPPAGTFATCDTAGVLNTAVMSVVSFQVTEALKIITGQEDQLSDGLLSIDVWAGRVSSISGSQRDPHCPTCVKGTFEFLEHRVGTRATSLCGRKSVQVTPGLESGPLDMDKLAQRLGNQFKTERTDYYLTFKTGHNEFVVFNDGRTIISGTSDESEALSLYSRFIGL